MVNRFRFFKRLFFELPGQVRLGYCLMRDPRVPGYTKAAFGGGLGILLSPWVNIPEFIPVIGELDALAVTLVALKLFIASCPDDVVIDLEQQIIEQTSVFDNDVRRGERIALAISRRWSHEPEQEIVGTVSPEASSAQRSALADMGEQQ